MEVPMQKWEYLRLYVYYLLDKIDTVSINGKSDDLKGKDWEALQIYINELGKEGWELVSHSMSEHEEALYFKRPAE
jgi:hypothetical protein